MVLLSNLPPNMEKYKYILEHQGELSTIYNKNKKIYKYEKQKEEKRRYREKLKEQKKLKKLNE